MLHAVSYLSISFCFVFLRIYNRFIPGTATTELKNVLILLLFAVSTVVMSTPVVVSDKITIVSVIFFLFIYFLKSLNDCRAQMLLFMYWHKTKRQNSSAPIMCTMFWAHMDCIGTNIASGDGGGGSLTSTSWILQHSCFYTKTPALGWTQTLTQEEQCTLGKTAGWNFEEGAAGAIYIPPSQLAQDAGSSMSYTVGVFGSKRVSETFHHRPFVSQPCRTLGANPRLLALKRLPAIGDRSSWLQHILCF